MTATQQPDQLAPIKALPVWHAYLAWPDETLVVRQADHLDALNDPFRLARHSRRLVEQLRADLAEKDAEIARLQRQLEASRSIAEHNANCLGELMGKQLDSQLDPAGDDIPEFHGSGNKARRRAEALGLKYPEGIDSEGGSCD